MAKKFKPAPGHKVVMMPGSENTVMGRVQHDLVSRLEGSALGKTMLHPIERSRNAQAAIGMFSAQHGIPNLAQQAERNYFKMRSYSLPGMQGFLNALQGTFPQQPQPGKEKEDDVLDPVTSETIALQSMNRGGGNPAFFKQR